MNEQRIKPIYRVICRKENNMEIKIISVDETKIREDDGEWKEPLVEQ